MNTQTMTNHLRHTEIDDLPPVKSMTAPLPVILVIGMAVGSIIMWAVSPVFWLWFAAKVAIWTTGEGRLTAPLALMIIGGVIVTAVVVGKSLGVMNRKHMSLTGLDRGKKHARTWNKSMRDDRENSRDRGLLEPIMFASLGLAAAGMMAYFVLFPKITLPG